MANKLTLITLLLFSFVLSFGVFDPVFGINPSIGLIDIFAFLLVALGFSFNFKVLIKKIDISIAYLLLLLFFLFFSSVLYGHSEHNKSVFNFKLLVMILLYVALSLQFARNPKHIHYSLLSFSIGVFIMVVLLNTIYSSGVINNKGRLLVFGENPNSTSARFALAAIYLVYVSIYNPFKQKFLRYLPFLMSFPIMYMVLQSGSRGSVLSLVFSLITLLYISNLKMKYKAFLSLLLIIISPYVINIFINTGSIAERLSVTISEGSLGAREEIWLSVLDIIITNPIVGVGEPGYFQEMTKLTGRAVDPHNLLLYILATGGVLSFVLFMLFYKKLILRTCELLRCKDILPFILLFNITLIALKTGGALTYSIMWFIFAVIASYPLPNATTKK